ncbi:3'(2'),5'-bisphosphate nucleotidase CysQ [soil metagenome]
MHNKYERELAVAREAARIAGEYIRAAYVDFVPIPDAPVTISTEIDKGSQELILQHLAREFPTDGQCAEETTVSKDGRNATSNRVWVVDPIDGTRGFVMKNGEFSVMIALTVDRKPVVGVVLEPVTMKTTYATLGGGCWTCTGDGPATKCQVKTETDLAKMTLVQSHSKPGKPSMPVVQLKPAVVLEMYSAGVKMAVVARGEADVYANVYSAFADWDICAGDILVTEAGGVVTGLKGETITYGNEGYRQNYGLIAASLAIHTATIAKLK